MGMIKPDLARLRAGTKKSRCKKSQADGINSMRTALHTEKPDPGRPMLRDKSDTPSVVQSRRSIRTSKTERLKVDSKASGLRALFTKAANPKSVGSKTGSRNSDRVLSDTETLSPRQVDECISRASPGRRGSGAVTAGPSFERLRMKSERSRWTKSSAEGRRPTRLGAKRRKAKPMHARLRGEDVDPDLASRRRNSSGPRCKKSKADAPGPRQLRLRADKKGPICKKSGADVGSPVHARLCGGEARSGSTESEAESEASGPALPKTRNPKPD